MKTETGEIHRILQGLGVGILGQCNARYRVRQLLLRRDGEMIRYVNQPRPDSTGISPMFIKTCAIKPVQPVW